MSINQDEEQEEESQQMMLSSCVQIEEQAQFINKYFRLKNPDFNVNLYLSE